MNSTNAEWVTIAVLGKTRGIRGEITAWVLSSKPDRYDDLQEVYLFGDGRRYEVESTWFHDSTLVFKFVGVDSPSDAQPLVGAEVRVPFSERAQLDVGEYYDSDLIGCEVTDRRTGESLGRVTAVQDGGGSGLLAVGELLIPFVRAICMEIDPANRRITVELPEGLKDINRS